MHQGTFFHGTLGLGFDLFKGETSLDMSRSTVTSIFSCSIKAREGTSLFKLDRLMLS
jgi:hypothetical protein